MGRQIHVDLEPTIPAAPARVHAALADYRGREMEVSEPTPGSPWSSATATPR
jgi:hypothetical protein